MRSLAVCPLLFAAACRFGVPALRITDSADLAVPALDLAAGDAAAPGDLASDPCGPSLTPPSGVLSVRCVIGNPPVIDGDVSEWGALDYVLTHENAQTQSGPSAWSGTPSTDDADSSARFSLRWDLSYLYVAVHVSDDIRGVHPSAPNYQVYLDDAVELYVDGMHDRASSYGADDHQYVVTADGHSQEFKTAVATGVVPAGSFAVQNDAAGVGFSVEYRVPWSVLGAAVAASGRTLGVDFQIDDDDDPNSQVLTHYLVWWNMTSAGCSYPSQCESNFGAAELVGR